MENEEITNPELAENDVQLNLEPAAEEQPAPAETAQEQVSEKKKTEKAPKPPKPELTPEQKKARSKKLTTIITYAVALACLVAGLLVPLYGATQPKLADRMLIKYVPAFFNLLLFPIAKKDVIPLPADGWFFPSLGGADALNIQALAIVLYVLVTVVGLFMLIPVILGKREKKTSAVCAYTIETIALVTTGTALFISLFTVTGTLEFQLYSLIIAFGGVFLMLAVQSIFHKGGLGVAKVILFAISFIGALFLLDFAALIPALKSPFGSLSKALGCGDVANFASGVGIAEYGLFTVISVEVFKSLSGMGVYEMITSILLIALTLLVILNLIVEAIELATGSKYNKNGVLNKNGGSGTFAIVRYSVTLIIAAAAIIMLVIKAGMAPGIYLYFVTLFALIELLYVIIRAAVLASKHKKSAAARAATITKEETPVFTEETFNFGEEEEQPVDTVIVEQPVYEQPVYEQQPVYYAQPEQQPAPVEEAYVPVEEEQAPVFEEEEEEQLTIPGTPAPVQNDNERTIVYNYRAVYNGPTDEFMNTLTDAEKIEFVQIFMEKTKGKISGVPEYNIGQDNSDFFPAVFIHINRARNIVSAGLLEKIYKQI